MKVTLFDTATSFGYFTTTNKKKRNKHMPQIQPLKFKGEKSVKKQQQIMFLCSLAPGILLSGEITFDKPPENSAKEKSDL